LAIIHPEERLDSIQRVRDRSHVPKHQAAASGLEDVIVALDHHCGDGGAALVVVLNAVLDGSESLR